MKSVLVKKTTTSAKANVQASKYQAGDMDFLETKYNKPMPVVFEHIDRSYKAMHSFFGLPLPIV